MATVLWWLPGFSITFGCAEMLNNNVLTGSARMAYGLLIGQLLAFGLYAGASFVNMLNPGANTWLQVSGWTLLVLRYLFCPYRSACPLCLKAGIHNVVANAPSAHDTEGYAVEVHSCWHHCMGTWLIEPALSRHWLAYTGDQVRCAGERRRSVVHAPRQ